VQDPQTGLQYWPPQGRYWPYNPETMQKKIDEGRILFPATADGTPRLKRFQSEAKSLYRPVSTWIAPWSEPFPPDGDHAVLRGASNIQGTREIRSLFGAKVFPYAKPVSLIKALIEQATSPADDIVLDFFAGSCTTAQAVLELNRQDGGSRQFIMVQLPEPLPEGSPARIAGYTSVADLGKERIRRVIARLQGPRKGHQGARRGNKPEDLGFRVFKLDLPAS
jgi:adenine-specific DNA-methyltransferase